MPRTASNIAAFVFAIVLTGVTFQQALTTSGTSHPAPYGAIVA
jgi:hypothetical protein